MRGPAPDENLPTIETDADSAFDLKNYLGSVAAIRPSRFDEMTDPRGVAEDRETRPGWDGVLDFFRKTHGPELVRLREQAQRLVQQNGVTYNVYGDPKGAFRPWEMDLVPHVVAEAEWKILEDKVTQRAVLFDLLLEDIYGPQTVLKEGVVPPELIHGHPGFLRACHGVNAPCRLPFYSADIGRSPDGSFWLLGDHTQALFGAGYALENRIVGSRVLDRLFADSHVHRLAGAFAALKRTLEAMAPANKDNPRVVLLTPGPASPFFFEHSYLARYLGYALVHGEDLAFRDDAVFLKTLSGLRRVDVILRFPYDTDSDPLEFDRHSTDGVAGLVQAVRAGTVAVANSLGSGILENPALLSFLRGACRHFLDQDLKLDNVATWWCGQPNELEYVLSHLSRLVIRPIVGEKGGTYLHPQDMTALEVEKLKAKIRQSPHLYVGQEKVNLSTTPVIERSGFSPRPMCLRTFAMALGGGYEMMPGGLTRIAASQDNAFFSDHKLSGSKDTWVVSSSPVPAPTLLKTSEEWGDDIVRSGGDVASRVAENLFWLGRYTERAEGLVRLLRVLLIAREEKPQSEAESDALLRAYVETAKAPVHLLDPSGPWIAASKGQSPSRLRALLEGGRIFQLLSGLYQAAHSVRDRLSDDVWMTFGPIQQVNQSLQKNQSPSLDAVLSGMDRLLRNLAAFDSLASQSMSRGQGWRFLDTGRRLERTMQTSEIVSRTLVVPVSEETSLIEAVMETNLSLATYRRRYLSRVGAVSALDLLLFDERNPRSLAHQAAKLKNHVALLPEERRQPGSTPEFRIVRDFLRLFEGTGAKALADVTNGSRPALEVFLEKASGFASALFDALNRDFFRHSRFQTQTPPDGTVAP